MMPRSSWSERLIILVLGIALVVYIVVHWPLARDTLGVLRQWLGG
jgi:predicted membrane-bound dolichyl-phosphate-mannose-protein mannosyltransferase